MNQFFYYFYYFIKLESKILIFNGRRVSEIRDPRLFLLHLFIKENIYVGTAHIS